MSEPKKQGRKKMPRTQDPPKRAGVSLHVYIPPELRRRLDRYIDGERLHPTYTTIVRLALEEFLSRRQGDRPPPEE